jgi:hypothetical protein
MDMNSEKAQDMGKLIERHMEALLAERRLIERMLSGDESKSRRSPTLLKLQWLAERVRKMERIKSEVGSGTYSVDSNLVAKAMLNID